MNFHKVGLDEGLSQSSVFAIHKDHLNRMWFATGNGLNCWDGEEMKQFFKGQDNSITIASNNLREIVQEERSLWIKSNNEDISVLNLDDFSFKKYELSGLTHISLYNNQIVAVTNNGLFSFDPEKERFYKNIELYDGNKIISFVYQDRSGTLWAIEEGNKILKKENGRIEVIEIPYGVDLTIRDLLLDIKDKLWIATELNGLFTYDLLTKKFKRIDSSSSPWYLNSLAIRDIEEDKLGRIWVGTFKGLYVFDTNSNTTSFINSASNRQGALSHNSIYSLYLSEDDYIWAGTYRGGVNYGKIGNPVFNLYNVSGEENTPEIQVVGAIIEDSKKNIWVGTEGFGLSYFDRKKKSFKNYFHTNDKTGLSESNVSSLCLTDNNKLLIGTHLGGLNVLDIKSGEFTHFKDSFNIVTYIIPYKNDFLISTDAGIRKFNVQNEQISDFIDPVNKATIDKTMIVHIMEDNQGKIWLSTLHSGLFVYNPKTKELINYLHDKSNPNSISSNYISSVIEDNLYRIWVGTLGAGFCLFDRETQKFTTYNKEKNELPSDFIHGFAQSRYGNLWIGTSRGLSRFDVEKQVFYNYDMNSGFPVKEIMNKTMFLTHNGVMYIGGLNGLISFKEEELLLTKTYDEIIFSKLEVNNNEIVPFDESKILDQDISITKAFTLKPNHTSFSINYSDCNYNPVLKNKYQYKLDGFDEEWVDAEYETSVKYTNLNPGRYKFIVRGTDAIYNPVTNEKSLDIIIKPPFTQTWYAFTFYLLVLLGLIFFFNYFYLGKVRLGYQLRDERKEKERIEELNLYKFRFFTNISHEFMTPLTIISSSIEKMLSKDKVSSDHRQQLLQVFKNTKRLKNLNRELLDFRKLEQGYLKLKIQELDIIPYLTEIYNTFSEIADSQNVVYEFCNNTDHLFIWCDPRQLDKVFFNLLSNAFKHVAKKDGKVKISVEDMDTHIEIKVSNNGEGIHKDDIDKVFNRFFQSDHQSSYREHYGSGIGLALSEGIIKAHKGNISCESELGVKTTFKVTLKKGLKHFDAKLIVEEKADNKFLMDKDLIFTPPPKANTFTGAKKEIGTDNTPVLLIVEDNIEIQTVIQDIFNESYKIELANDGHEGLNKALELQPDIIISDIKMPKITGFELCEKLKRNINTSHIPILLLTAMTSEEDKVTGFKCGADSYITKPFSSITLKARVDNLFNNRKVLQEKYSKSLDSSTKQISRNQVDQVFIEKAQKIIEVHINDSEFSANNFAAEMEMSRSLFFRKIKAITGQTPNDFIQTIRLKKAAEILVSDFSKNVSEIAYDVGFNSPGYFSQCFKKHFGVMPSKYGKSDSNN